MRVPITRLSLSTAAALGAAALFAACSDSTTAPSRGLSPSSPDLAVVVQQTINSGSGTRYCGYNATETPVLGTVFAAPAGAGVDGCVAAQPLNAALASYNPGWGAPFNASDQWIGPTDHLDPAHFPGALSNQYVADTGTYQFKTTFDVPSDAIPGSLTNGFSMQVKSDNAVAVYLNGTYIGGNTGNMQDCPTSQTNCNWTNAGAVTVTGTPVIGTNSVRIDLLGSSIGYQLPGFTQRSNCNNGPQFTGFLGFTNTTVATPQHLGASPNWIIESCKNPTGLDFTATVSFDNTPPPSTTWCSPGFWKNHPGSPPWPAGYQTLKYNSFSGSYVRDPKTFVGYDFGKKVGSSNPSLLEVISNPSIYGGPATNNVADILSNVVFGTPIGSGVESCPDPSSPLFNPPS